MTPTPTAPLTDAGRAALHEELKRVAKDVDSPAWIESGAKLWIHLAHTLAQEPDDTHEDAVELISRRWCPAMSKVTGLGGFALAPRAAKVAVRAAELWGRVRAERARALGGEQMALDLGEAG